MCICFVVDHFSALYSFLCPLHISSVSFQMSSSVPSWTFLTDFSPYVGLLMSDFQGPIISPFLKKNAEYSSRAFKHMMFPSVLMREVPVSVTLAQAVLQVLHQQLPFFSSSSLRCLTRLNLKHTWISSITFS